jgi:predicted nuclease of predicted toxin-antitoxin system
MVSFYFDEMMSRKAAEQLIQRGYTVVTANDVGMREKADSDHLVYATAHGPGMVTFDRRFAGQVASKTDHRGLVCLAGTQDNIGGIVRALAAFAEQHTSEEVTGHVFWLK